MTDNDWPIDPGPWSVYNPHAPRRPDDGVIRVQREPDVYACNSCHFQGTYAVVLDHVERRVCVHPTP